MLPIKKAILFMFLCFTLYVREYYTLSRTGLELLLLPTRYDFKESLERCRQHDMILAQPKTKELMDFSNDYLQTTNFSILRTSSVWVNLMKSGNEWKWGDNSVFELKNEWSTDGPASGIGADCAGLKDSGFYGNPCSLERNPLCQKNIPSVGKVFSVDYRNFIPLTKAMKSTTVSSRIYCAIECLRIHNCESFVLKTERSIQGLPCLLYDTVFKDEEMTQQTDAEYYVKYFPHD